MIFFNLKKWLRFGKLQYLNFIYVNHKLFCITNDILNFFIKKNLQIMPLNHFLGEEIYFESLLNNDNKRFFFSNDLKFGMFMYYACVEF